jgi:hypothetical protein
MAVASQQQRSRTMSSTNTHKRKLQQHRFDFAANPVPRDEDLVFYEDHPLAAAFPMMEGEDLMDLVADVRERGLRQRIILYQDKVLDGRNRLRACIGAGVRPRFEFYAGDDPVGYIVSLNLRRRHLDASQRAMVAARLATLKLGWNQYTKEGARIQAPSQKKAAAMFNVGRDSVQKGRVVVERGSSDLQRAVDSGRISISAAAAIALADKDSQVRVLAMADHDIVDEAARIKRKGQVTKAARKLSDSRADLFSGLDIKIRADAKKHLDAIIESAVQALHQLDRIVADAMWKLDLGGRAVKGGQKRYLKEVEAMPTRIKKLLNEFAAAAQSAPKAESTRPQGPRRHGVPTSRRRSASPSSKRNVRKRGARRRG